MNIKMIDERLTELRSHLTSSQERLRALEAQRSELQATMLRISGAIDVLEEFKRDSMPPTQQGA